MDCGTCGATITTGYRFCGTCGAPVPEEQEAPPPTRDRLRLWARRLVLAALALTALAALAGSALLGWELNNRLGDEPDPVAVTLTRPITVIEEEQAPAGFMPSVLGLDEATARQVLLDAGVEVEDVTTDEQPSAGAPGLVVTQEPAAGTALAGGDGIVLALSAPATMPPLVDGSLADARAALADLGASVVVESRYEPGADEEVVLETTPASGEALPNRVTLVVAEAPSSVFLSELQPIDTDCGVDTVNLAGRERPDAFVCSLSGPGFPDVLEYVLNGRVSTFAAVAGLADRSEPGPATLRVFVDGAPRLRVPLRLGAARRVVVPVDGALRIRIEVVAARDVGLFDDVDAVIAGARFLGGRDAIDELVAESNL